MAQHTLLSSARERKRKNTLTFIFLVQLRWGKRFFLTIFVRVASGSRPYPILTKIIILFRIIDFQKISTSSLLDKSIKLRFSCTPITFLHFYFFYMPKYYCFITKWQKYKQPNGYQMFEVQWRFFITSRNTFNIIVITLT